MHKQISYERLLVLYIPWALASLLSSDAVLSYFIAWLGSFLIFWATLTGWVKPLPTDLRFGEQLMRPLILVQIIFAGYMCCTSIFYLMDTLGYTYFEKPSSYFLLDENRLFAVAQCQRYYLLAHTAFVSGILVFMKYPEKQKFMYDNSRIISLLFYMAIITFPLYLLFNKLPGLSQFSNQFSSLSFIAVTLALAFAIPEKKVLNTLICLFLYFSNFYSALISGFKEPIIISVLVLGIFLYPNYKKVVLLTFIPLLFVLFLLLPTYARIFRENAWEGITSEDEAAQLALNSALGNDPDSELDSTNWGFMVYRLSEIDMFIKFVQSTPEKVDYYGFDLVKQSAIVIVPRIFWPSKPSTEELVMERVYDAGVIYRGSRVSAKPAYVVDAYLSGGQLGIFIALFIYGAIAQLISQKAEQLFGGYLLGTALIFSGLFQIFWRGLSFEFIANTVFWSFVTMLIIHYILKTKNIIQKA
ncbi:exosortase Y-associated Wzy-like protein [Mucilaginibacter boryungensis]|uniref:Oligosaccharide repeat unit polymerase n=1 Tax=Mucilaginibacter boryungensis TaxID=768480 RepID=A0ABR9XFE1_9SPHI|nr:hypothetical protein [Mucilaginibacter boryungensis]MBE9665986.1 hypothetical protein [Mucilaginibacter boryungensis]